MTDLLYLAAVVAFFAVMVGVVGVCRRVVGGGDYDTLDVADVKGIEDHEPPVLAGHDPQ
jgi:hypothetical protein